MKKFWFVCLCLIVFCSAFMVVIGIRMVKVKTVAKATPAFTPSPIEFKLEPPQNSLIGKVTRIDGGATKLARDEENPVIVEKDMMILEGEQITASESGSVAVQFAKNDLISISPNAIIAFPSTNSKNFLVKQDKGVISYETDVQIATISARSLHALFSLSQGKAELAVDPDKKVIVFTLVEGHGEIGYIDSDNKTQTAEVTAGQTLTYDDTKRTIAIQ